MRIGQTHFNMTHLATWSSGPRRYT